MCGRMGDGERSGSGASAGLGGEQDADSAGVDERRLFEVEHDTSCVGLRLEQDAGQLRSSGEVDLAYDDHALAVVVDDVALTYEQTSDFGHRFLDSLKLSEVSEVR